MQRNKKLHSVIAATTVCILLVAGTFAWTNFSASIVNSFFGTGNSGGNEEPGPGGTLHNDFEEGLDYRDVYVENWGTEPLIVRIKLTEYMEIGEGAGNENGTENNHAISIVDGASIDDPNTWTPFDGDIGEGIHRSLNGFRNYWNWTMGGQKRFFPAPVDLRGTRDENGVDFVSTTGPVGNSDDLPTVYRLTLDAEVLSMAEWITRGRPLGHYWVVDVDGYSYWAAPLEPEEATGLLLHKVELNNRPIEDFYYAINVAAHMATIDDVPDNYEKLLLDASENASLLVNKVADAIREQSDLPVALFRVESIGRPDIIDFNEFEKLEPVILQSRDEAHTFYHAHTKAFSHSAWTIDFQNAVWQDETLINSRFDNDFFEERALVFIPFMDTLGSEYPVTNIKLIDGVMEVEIGIIDGFSTDWSHTHWPHYHIVSICRSLIGNEIRMVFFRSVRPTPTPWMTF